MFSLENFRGFVRVKCSHEKKTCKIVKKINIKNDVIQKMNTH